MLITLLGLEILILCRRDIHWACRALGLRCPAAIDTMWMSGEPGEYMAAAIMAVNQIGE